MDKGSFFLNTHDETPPPKKRRRLHPPGFESSFHHLVNPSPSKPPRRTTTIQSRLLITEFTSMFENRGRERRGTPSKPPRLVPDECAFEVYMDSGNGKSPAHHLHSHRKKGVPASFSEFTSTFDVPLPPSTSKPLSKIAHYPPQFSSPDMLRTRPIETGLVISTARTPRTPMHVLKPPQLREAVEFQNHSLSKNYSPQSGRVSHLLGISTGADIDKLRSMTSHLTSLQGAVSHLVSPKHIAAENRKLLPIAPPILAPESPKGMNEAATMATSSTVSHAERAEILASSVRVSRTYQSANVEFSELSRGLELSPQKSGRAHGRKLLKGGLAERAEHLLFRSRTNFSLWQVGFAKQLEGAKHTKENLRLRISSILSSTKGNTTNSFSDGLPRTTIAKCTEVLKGAPEAEGGEGLPWEGTVVFLFANHERVSSAVNFQEGKEVCVWRPWQEIELPDVNDRLDLLAQEVRTFPTPGGSTAGRRTALLCSRFLVSV